jgi:AraC family transcriptional regulator
MPPVNIRFPAVALGKNTQKGPVGEASSNIFVDFAARAPAPTFGFEKRLDIGSVTLAYGTFQPSHGAWIGFSKMTVATHDSAAISLDWRPPGNNQIRTSVLHRGRVMLANANELVWKRWARPRSIFAFAMDENFVSQISQEAFNGSTNCTVETLVELDDPVIERLCILGQRELNEGGGSGKLYIEGLASSLTVYLLRQYGTSRRSRPIYKGGLPAKQLRRIVEYINIHLRDELRLAELAAISGMSPHHFGEAFKISMGKPPHRYVTEKRVYRARELLRKDWPISDVAYAVGFSSQSHLTTNFRRLMGITPARFRRSQS